jgi:DNA-binding PadR family transcriptional regulator
MINKIFDSTLRVQLLTLLSLRKKASFTELKTILRVSDGNLSVHLKKLEEANFIEVKKKFVGRKPKTVYYITEVGKKEFIMYLTDMEKILKKLKEEKKWTEKKQKKG